MISSSLTVLVAADSYDLTTLDAVKTELRLGDETKYDDTLQQLIRRASGLIAENCRRVFGLERVRETLRIRDGGVETIRLSRYPVREVFSLVVGGAALAASDYALNEKAGLLTRPKPAGDVRDISSCWWGAGDVVADYSGGYALLGDLPQTLEEAAILQVKSMFYNVGRDPMVRQEDVPGVRSVTYWVGPIGASSTLPPEVLDKISGYRNPAI